MKAQNSKDEKENAQMKITEASHYKNCCILYPSIAFSSAFEQILFLTRNLSQKVRRNHNLSHSFPSIDCENKSLLTSYYTVQGLK